MPDIISFTALVVSSLGPTVAVANALYIGTYAALVGSVSHGAIMVARPEPRK